MIVDSHSGAIGFVIKYWNGKKKTSVRRLEKVRRSNSQASLC